MNHPACHCGNTLPYSDCCEPLHQKRNAKTPEALMRSRFSAFKLGLVDYLLATHHSSQHQANERQSLVSSCESYHWQKLCVLKNFPVNGTQGQVAFAAYFEKDGQTSVLCELSDFVFEDGRWLYTTGQQTENENQLAALCKFTRNDLCWCGSGKKFKKCHMD